MAKKKKIDEKTPGLSWKQMYKNLENEFNERDGEREAEFLKCKDELEACKEKIGKCETELLKCKEENKKLKETIQKDFDANLNAEKMRAARDHIIKELRRSQENADLLPFEWEGGTVTDDEDNYKLPTILQPFFEYNLMKVVSHLDLGTATTFFRTCKKIQSMADRGLFKIPITLSCVKYKESGLEDEDDRPLERPKTALVLEYKNRVMKYQELVKLHGNRWMRPEILRFILPGYPNLASEAKELLKYLGVKRIGFLETERGEDAVEFLTNYEVTKLKCHDLYSSDIFKPELFRTVSEAHLEINLVMNYDEKKMIMNFLETTRFAEIVLLNRRSSLPKHCAQRLIEKWLKGETISSAIVFSIQTEENEELLAELLDRSHLHIVEENLCDLTRAQIRFLVEIDGASIICGTQHTFVVIREDLKMLRIGFMLANEDIPQSVVVIEKL